MVNQTSLELELFPAPLASQLASYSMSIFRFLSSESPRFTMLAQIYPLLSVRGDVMSAVGAPRTGIPAQIAVCPTAGDLYRLAILENDG